METGITPKHARVFQEVADVSNSIIACRAVGKYAAGLIREGYSSKGFHNKAKSCNWGPMAGFVLADPRFTKALDIQGQSETLVAAYLEGATQVPLFISDARVRWLGEQHLFDTVSESEGKRFVRAYSGPLIINFVLHQDQREGLTKGLWAVNYQRAARMDAAIPLEAKFTATLAPAWPIGKGPKAPYKVDPAKDPKLAAQLRAEAQMQAQEKAENQIKIEALLADGQARTSIEAQRKGQADRDRADKKAALLAGRRTGNPAVAPEERDLVPVMAVRDPHCTVPANDYRSATTGDYDLFAVWPRKVPAQSAASHGVSEAEMMDVVNLDRRMIETRKLEERIRGKKLYSYESRHQGNLTPRIAEIKHLLNGGFMRAGYTGGNMVHHSDEGGRPFVKDIDLPVFAVVPGKTQAYCFTSVDDMRAFVREHAEYDCFLNKGWQAQML